MHMHIVEESMQKKGRVIEGMGMSGMESKGNLLFSG